jgi:two-component sensor histidine kinase
LKDLYKQVAAVFQKDDHEVEVSYEVEDTYFDIDTIVPLGLIANELFTNSFKYAFNNGVAGKIVMSMSKIQKGSFILTYQDNGPGLPEQFDIQKASSLGLRLIYRLGNSLEALRLTTSNKICLP